MVLVRAFMDDPVFVAAVPDVDARRRMLLANFLTDFPSLASQNSTVRGFILFLFPEQTILLCDIPWEQKFMVYTVDEGPGKGDARAVSIWLPFFNGL